MSSKHWRKAEQIANKRRKYVARLEYLSEFDQSKLSAEQRAQLLAGYLEACPACGGFSAYCWEDCDDDIVAHIGAADCFSFQCGHCRNYIAERDSVYMADCFTHCNS